MKVFFVLFRFLSDFFGGVSVYYLCIIKNEYFLFQPLDVPKHLLALRNQRMLMVQTLSQYTFVYRVLIQYLRNSRLI